MDIHELPGNTLLIIQASDLRAHDERLLKLYNIAPAPVAEIEKPSSQEESIEFLGISRPTFIRWRKQGKIKGHTIGGRVYFFKSELVAAIKKDPCSSNIATH